ncbi:MAG: helicase HerA-like domain-containing protein [Candidatus Diapherotrites archaeon]
MSEEEEKPRAESGEEKHRVEKSIVKEDNDIFDEVFEGKKEKRVEQRIEETEEEEKEMNEKEGKELGGEEELIPIKEKKKKKEKEKKLKGVEGARQEMLQEKEKDKLKREIIKKALKSATIEPEIMEPEIEEVELEPEEISPEDIEGLGEKYLKEELGEKESEVELIEPATVPLRFLEYEAKNSVFIGRKKSVFQSYKDEAGLLIGRVEEDGKHKEKTVLLDGLNPHVIFVCGARGSGKCLTGDSLITLEDGSIIPIKELEYNNKRVLGLNHELKIVPLKKEGFYKRKVDKLFSLLLRSGREIKLTPEHPLLTINGWVQAQELKRKDSIATPRILNVFGNSKMKEGDVKLLAYFIAEGHLGNAFVLFSNQDKKIIEDFSKSIREFDENLRIEVHSKSWCYRIAQKKKGIDLRNIVRNEKGQFTNKGFVITQKSSLAKWFESIGLYGKLSKEKFIPEEILKLSKEQLALFLNRLFSCDGSIHKVSGSEKNWLISYASSSEKLIRQVQHLLLRFGIISKIKPKKTKFKEKIFDSFELVISSESVIKFIQEIGFFGIKELRQETAIKNMLEINRNPNIDTIPKDIWDIYRPKNWTATARAMGYSQKSLKSLHNAINYAPSREKLLKIAQIDENKGVQLIAESDIFWDEVVELKEIEGEEVYDISVPEYHNFIANDIIVHNSYVLGVIAEELALRNKNIGTIVIDPVGVFWSMRYPNKEEKELKELIEWNLMPQGLENLKVFVPEGIKAEIPRNTYDATFAVLPSMLSVEDWCLTFGMERFGPTGLLLDKVLKKIEHGYKTTEAKYIKAKKGNYSLEELIQCLETEEELNSKERGYKQDSIRALASRLEAAKNWGIFSEKGTPLSELSRENQLTVLDTSFLEDNVGALVIGILARRILSARKISTRKESAKKLKASMDEMLELEIPPTWLFIDEAHTLIPSGNVKTPATEALVEYVKQGRRPGCSIVFATQQPSAIDTKVLSQLDILISHKLVFDDDIKAIYKRIPTIIPFKYKKSNFIRTLPIGKALVGDRREETSRAFVLSIRPRISQHEGRDVEATSIESKMSEEQVQKLAVEMLISKLNREGEIELPQVNSLIDTLNSKYKTKVMLSSVLDALEDKMVSIDSEKIFLPSAIKKEEEIAERKELIEEKGIERGIEGKAEEMAEAFHSFPIRFSEERARRIAESARKKKKLGLIGREEQLKSLNLYYEKIFKIQYNDFNQRQEFFSNNCYVSSETGEFLHATDREFIESKGFSKVIPLGRDEASTLGRLIERKNLKELIGLGGISEEKAKKVLEELTRKGFVKKELKEGKASYFLNSQLELPPNPRHKIVNSLDELPLTEIKAGQVKKENFTESQVMQALQNYWPSIVIKKLSLILKPYFEAVLEEAGKERRLKIDAITGKII